MFLINYWNYLVYCFRFNLSKLVIFIINLILLVYSIIDESKNISGQVQFFTYLVLGVNILWQLIGLFGDIYSWSKTIYSRMEINPQNFSSYSISEKERENKYRLITHGQNALLSEEVNLWLRTVDKLEAYRDKGKEKKQRLMIKRNFDTFQSLLKCKLQESTRVGFYNQKTMCLSDDIGFNEAPIGLYKGDYYTFYLTNAMYSFRFRYDDNSLHFSPLFEKYGHQIPDIRCSDMNNPIGVNTIAFTKDGYVFFLQQNTKADSSAGLLTPSGSGVSNWSDYQNGDFIQSILNATNRELFEECGGHIYQNIANTTSSKIIGFFRWLDKGGKPEFISISAIDRNISDIFPQSKEQTSEIRMKYIKNRKSDNIEWDILSSFLDEIQQDAMCSFPLYMSIYTLKEYIQVDRNQFAKDFNLLFSSFKSRQ